MPQISLQDMEPTRTLLQSTAEQDVQSKKGAKSPCVQDDNIDSSHSITTSTKLKPPLGGLKNLERLLGLRIDRVLATDAVFISLDLEVASDRKTLHPSGNKPIVTQLGFARLDTRDVYSISSSSDMRRLISLRTFKVTGLSLSKTSQSKGKKRCVFATPKEIVDEQVPP